MRSRGGKSAVAASFLDMRTSAATASGLGLLLVSALAGCAFVREATTYRPGPTPEALKAEADSFQLPKLPEEGKAVVYVVRPSGIGMLIRFNVFVDNQGPASEMGYTRGSQHIYFQVLPGSHTIYSKAENWAQVQIAPGAGDVVFVKQEPGMGLLMARNSLSVVDEAQGKRDVKRTSLGSVIKSEHDAGGGFGVAPEEEEAAKPEWRALPPGTRVKVYSQSGTYAGELISFQGDTLWIATDGGGRKALDSFRVEKLAVLRPR